MFRLVMPVGVGLPENRQALGPEGNHGDRRNGQGKRQKRRQKISEFVRARRRHVFLEQKFHAIGQRLQQAVRADAVGSPSGLNVRHDFALKPGEIGKRREQNEKQDDDFRQRDDQKRMLRGEFVHGRASTSASSAASGRERTMVQIAGQTSAGEESVAGGKDRACRHIEFRVAVGGGNRSRLFRFAEQQRGHAQVVARHRLANFVETRRRACGARWPARGRAAPAGRTGFARYRNPSACP